MRTLSVASVLLAVFLVPAAASADPIIHVYTALAPNAYGSPSYPGWQVNAVTAMQNAGAATGTPGTPSYFQTQATVTSAEAIVTGFPSWLGQADPASVFGAPFGAELGNRMHFPLWIDGNGSSFSLSQLGLNTTSSDPGNALAYSWLPGTYNYSAGYVGLNYGGDATKGTGDDFFVNGGPNTQLVNELFGRGSGNSFAAYCPGCTVAQQQAEINLAAAYPGSDFTFTGTYFLLGAPGAPTGSATFNVTAVPEPASLLLLGAGLAVAGFSRRRHELSR